MCFADSKHLQVVFSHFCSNLKDSSGLPHCSDIPCTYKSCRSGCKKVHRPHDFRRNSAFIMRRHNYSFYSQGR
ncbi:unnamed protein product, partial [Schistosoma rodhaini]